MGFSMVGSRVGVMVVTAEVAAARMRLTFYLDYVTFQPIQVAATVAMIQASDYPAQVREAYRGRGDALCDGLNRIGWAVEAPRGTMFVWAPIAEPYAELGSYEFVVRLAREAL